MDMTLAKEPLLLKLIILFWAIDFRNIPITNLSWNWNGLGHQMTRWICPNDVALRQFPGQENPGFDLPSLAGIPMILEACRG
jgi:hypothetical protein